MEVEEYLSCRPVGLDGRKEHLKTIIREKDGSKAFGYREVVLEDLKRFFGDLCGYCRQKTEFLVDHYRPKAALKQDEEHAGYYWLAYEWSNLVPICNTCNGPGAKGTSFPLLPEGSRLWEPELNREGLPESSCCNLLALEAREQPALLHPFKDKFERHLFFNPDGSPVDRDERGYQTIKTCKLDRDYLVIERKKIVDDYRNRMKKAMNRRISQEIELDELRRNISDIFDDMVAAMSSRKPFHQVHRLVYGAFKTFIYKPLIIQLGNDTCADELLRIYRDYQRDHSQSS